MQSRKLTIQLEFVRNQVEAIGIKLEVNWNLIHLEFEVDWKAIGSIGVEIKLDSIPV